MRNVKFDCVVTCSLTPTLTLQQQEVTLKPNGPKWTGSLTVGVDEILLIYCKVAGTGVESWALEISTSCPKGIPDRVFSDGDPMPHGGAYAFYTSTKVPDPICGGVVAQNAKAVAVEAAVQAAPKKSRKAKD